MVAEQSNYHFYRVIAGDRKFRVSNFLKAMDAAVSDDVDIINFSAGIHHEDCGGRCRPCSAARSTVRQGITVVAGAGNDLEGGGSSLFCPAYSDEVIGVGAFHTLCGYSIQPHQSEFPFRPNPLHLPPNCYYLDPPEAEDRCELYGEKMCGQMGCGEFISCEEHKEEKLWYGNVDFSKTRPDVFAPSHLGHRDGENRLRYHEGTSFSAAYVTGSLAGIFGALNRSQAPTPSEVRSAIVVINDTVGETSWLKYNAETVFDFLS